MTTGTRNVKNKHRRQAAAGGEVAGETGCVGKSGGPQADLGRSTANPFVFNPSARRATTRTAGRLVCVEVDDSDAAIEPDCVTLAKRSQTLNSVLGGVIESCEDTCTFSDNGTPTDSSDDFCDGTGDGIITIAFECTVTEEEIKLILDSMQASHFNFVAPVSSGLHNIKVKAYLDTGADSTSGSAEAKALIGWGVVVAEEIHLVGGSGAEIVLDSDGDGVNDQDDLCPFDDGGGTVDADGCPIP